jgi:hypothetical protein
LTKRDLMDIIEQQKKQYDADTENMEKFIRVHWQLKQDVKLLATAVIFADRMDCDRSLCFPDSVIETARRVTA